MSMAEASIEGSESEVPTEEVVEEQELDAEEEDEAMSPSAAYNAVAKTVGLTEEAVKHTIDEYMTVAAKPLQMYGETTLGSHLNLQLQVKLTMKTRKGVNTSTGKPCVFKSKHQVKKVKAIPMKKFMEMIN